MRASTFALSVFSRPFPAPSPLIRRGSGVRRDERNCASPTRSVPPPLTLQSRPRRPPPPPPRSFLPPRDAPPRSRRGRRGPARRFHPPLCMGCGASKGAPMTAEEKRLRGPYVPAGVGQGERHIRMQALSSDMKRLGDPAFVLGRSTGHVEDDYERAARDAGGGARARGPRPPPSPRPPLPVPVPRFPLSSFLSPSLSPFLSPSLSPPLSSLPPPPPPVPVAPPPPPPTAPLPVSPTPG